MYDIDVLMAMRWTCTEWKTHRTALIKNVIFHCLRNDGKGDLDVGETGGFDEICVQIEQNATENGMNSTRIDMKDLIYSEDEEDVVKTVTFEKPGRTAAGVAEKDVKEMEKDVLLEDESLYSVEKERKGLPVSNKPLD